MSPHAYAVLLEDFCARAGITAWQHVERTGHIEILGRTIGLIRHEAANGEGECEGALHVYVDLGSCPAASEAGLYRRLLTANLDPRRAAGGCFGMHPATGHMVYHMRIPAPVSGDDVVRCLEQALDADLREFELLAHG